MSRLWIISSLLALCCYSANGQVKRHYQSNGRTVEVWAQNNRMENNFSFPGMKVFIVIGTSQSVDTIYAQDSLRLMPLEVMNDYACFYYLCSAEVSAQASLHSFLGGFINWCYQLDLIDRNAVTVVWQGANSATPNCDTFNKLGDLTGAIYLLGQKPQNGCSEYLAPSADYIWQQSRKKRTSIRYDIPGMTDMETKEQQEKQQHEMVARHHNKRNIFFQATVGRHEISQGCRTGFDTSTLVDFSRSKTLWDFNAGYYIINRIFIQAELAFIYSGKNKQLDSIGWNGNGGIKVTGSGSAGAMIRYGLGLGYIAYQHKRLDIITRFSFGSLSAVAGGGSGTRTIGGSSSMDITKEKRQTCYYNLSAGLRYHLGSSIYFTSNFQYNISKFDQPIGSVIAFTGWSLNGGLGLVLRTKKDRYDDKQ